MLWLASQPQFVPSNKSAQPENAPSKLISYATQLTYKQIRKYGQNKTYLGVMTYWLKIQQLLKQILEFVLIALELG